MKRILFLIIITCGFLFSYSQDSAWIRNNYHKKEVYITMRDGVRLFTSMYIPNDNTTDHPILMTRTPYSCSPYGEDNFRNFWSNHNRQYFKDGYIIVIQDVRGRWMSEGQFEDVRPFNADKRTKKDIDESSDTYDTIDWLVKSVAHNNGKVGVFGISYPGFYSTMAAASNHPALKAVSPQAPVTEWFLGDDFHHNGALSLIDAFSFYSSFGKPRPKPTIVGPSGFTFPVQDNYAFFLRTGALPNFSALMGDSIAFWKDLYSHPDYDQWWQARNARRAMYNIKPALLVVGGTFDAEDCYGAWNLFKAIENQTPETNSSLIMGPWYHGQWANNAGLSIGNIQFDDSTSAYYTEHFIHPFFNYYLKNEGDISNIKKATIFFSGENKWRQFEKWPAPNMQMTAFYLQPGGKISNSRPVQTNSFTEYTSDPSKPVPYTDGIHLNRTREYMTDDQRFASRRTDVAVFQTDILKTDITLGGPIVADLDVSISTTDADFVVKLIDVFPDDFAYEQPKNNYPMGGYQMLVRGEIMRGKYRNSFEHPKPFIPGKPTKVKFTLPDIAHTFKKGHRLMIQIQSSWFPLMDRNPQKFMDIYKAKDSDFQPSVIRIHHAAGNASAIYLPVIK
ncbi:MAG: CocE/NonD family hydrolase [Bacteroidetes bacterium]|nr:CocE/NonD family hydrolase [Bacteroidota bacterium]